jgi:hypothetical protein
MAVWTAMDDLSTGELVTEADMDAIRGNIEYLLDPNSDSVAYDNSADYTTTSATYVDVDATNVTMSVTTSGGPLLLIASFVATNGLVTTPGFQFDVGSVAVKPVTATIGASQFMYVTLVALHKPASAGAKTIKLQYKADGANTLTIFSNGENVNMDAIEI